MLIVFGGLPATGKSTISLVVARAMEAVHIRVDTIEQTLRDVGFKDLGGTGYVIAYRIGTDNLALGRTVVADSVNPISITRDEWVDVGEKANVVVKEIETICSDRAELKRRIETRLVNIEGLRLPTWAQVLSRDYEPWQRDHLVIDTAGESPGASAERALWFLAS